MKKYKYKTSSAAKKRFKITKNGKFLRRKANKSHILEKKAQSRKRKLRNKVTVTKADYLLVSKMLGLN